MGSVHQQLHVSFLLLLLLLHRSLASAAAFRCLSDQASALLQLKQSFQEPYLPSWRVGTDCCYWEGVSCDAASGRVTALDLSGHGFQSNLLDPAVFRVTSLQYLNLAGNNFNGSTLPASGFERLTELTRLNLSNAGFAGQIPIGIASLTNLASLDLSTSIEQSSLLFSLEFKEPSFRTVIANLSNMRELYLDGVNISSTAEEWCSALAESVPQLRVLSLEGCNLPGPIHPSLSRLRSLAVINLSYNSVFSGTIPEFFADFPALSVLQLSNNNFTGSFPWRIMQLKKLRVLDLFSNNMLSGSLPDFPANSSLEILDLRGTNFSGAIPSSIGNLRSLKTLDLGMSSGPFSGGLPSSIANLKSLEVLDLGSSGFSIGEFPSSIGNLNSLSTLRLRECGISGPIPLSMANLTRLTLLDLSENNLTGPISFYTKGAFMNLKELHLCCNSLSEPIPGFMFSLPALEFLSLLSNRFSGSLQEFSNPSSSLTNIYLNYNELNGSIPRSFFQLTGLETLDLSSNDLSGTVELSLFWKLTNLSNFALGNNRLSVIDGENNSLSRSFPNINYLGLASCNLTKIPNILRHIVISDLDLSWNQIGGAIPKWIWEDQTDIDIFKFNLSHNSFTSLELPLAKASIYYLDLSFNNLQGPMLFPKFPQFVDYSNNLFSFMPSNWTALLSSSFYISLSNNKLNGHIPHTICNASKLQLLDLSYNYFSGSIPSCLIEDGNVSILKLRENQFEGMLPNDIEERCVFRTIDLNGNQIEGHLPRSLSNCIDLEVLDIGNNHIVDSFPSWLGDLSNLTVMVLRSNQFYGPVGVPLRGDQIRKQFSSLQILDLASNNFSGNLHSEWFEKLQSMIANSNDGRRALENVLSGKFYRDTVIVTYKGSSLMISRILTTFTVIDISNNTFNGSIPESIGRLASLHGLNMSHNALTGTIPSQLSGMTQLESLDLSWNQLSGKIPQELTSLTSLAWLNLSYNNLFGSIPLGGQFLSFTNSSFEGNVGLCGRQLSRQCDNSNSNAPTTSPPSEPNSGSEDRFGIILLFVFAGLGFGMGFAMVILFRFVCGVKGWSCKLSQVVNDLIA